MAAVRLLVGQLWRRSRVGWIVLAALVALTVLVSVATVAAARRSLLAYPRALDRVAAPDATMGIGNPDDSGGAVVLDPDAIAAMPGVVEIGVSRALLATGVDEADLLDPNSEVGVQVALDERIWRTVGRMLVLEGRLPRPDESDAVAVSAGLADHLDLEVGDTIRFAVVDGLAYERALAGDLTAGDRVQPTIVGITQPVEFGAESASFEGRGIYASEAFLRAHPGTGTYRIASVRLADGPRGVAALTRAMEEISATSDLLPRSQSEAQLRRVIGPEVAALAALGGLVALAGVAIVLQGVHRQLSGSAADALVLASLGVTRRIRSASMWAAGTAVVLAGSVLGGILAVLASALGPVGTVRRLEPGHSLRLDPLVHGLGATGLVMLLALLIVPLAWRAARLPEPAHPAARPGPLARALAAGSPSWRIAASMAGRREGARRQVRSIAAGVGATVGSIALVGTLSSTVDHLLATPSLYGHGYDLAAFYGYGAYLGEQIPERFAADSDIARTGRMAEATGTVEGDEARLYGFDLPDLGPSLLRGRVPANDHEVMVGPRLLESVGASVGDTVEVTVGQVTRAYEVVGVALLPGADGAGAGLAYAGVERLAPTIEPSWQYVALRSGVDPAAVQARYSDPFGDCTAGCDINPPTAPEEIAYFDEVGALPQLVVLALAAAGTLGAVQGIVLLGRRNRRTVATLRSFGATTGQATRCVVAQAALATGAGVALGIPAGVLGVRPIWTAICDRVGVLAVIRVPSPWIAGAAALVVIVSISVALPPSWRAARRSVAEELSHERPA